MWKISAIKGFVDNYFWLIEAPEHQQVMVVDPGEAGAILAYLESHQLQLVSILITHHHADHTGGIGALLAAFPAAKVYASATESLAVPHIAVSEGDCIPAWDLGIDVLAVGGHTRGHIAFYQAKQGCLFCGDTLFAGGCGRVFEGTMTQMQASLAKIQELPDKTQIYCAHEYTEANLGFALWVEPDNVLLIKRMALVKQQRLHKLATVPSPLAMEQQTNPFLRYDVPSVIAAAEAHAGHPLNNAAEVFGHLRDWKDSEYD